MKRMTDVLIGDPVIQKLRFYQGRDNEQGLPRAETAPALSVHGCWIDAR